MTLTMSSHIFLLKLGQIFESSGSKINHREVSQKIRFVLTSVRFCGSNGILIVLIKISMKSNLPRSYLKLSHILIWTFFTKKDMNNFFKEVWLTEPFDLV